MSGTVFCLSLSTVVVAMSSAAAPPPPLATPTDAQLTWMKDEIGAIGHFNMGYVCVCMYHTSITAHTLSTSIGTTYDTDSFVGLDPGCIVNQCASMRHTYLVSTTSRTFEGCGIGDAWLEGPKRVGSTSGISLPPPQTFAPEAADADGWVKALASFGVKRAVLVVSHGCGFNTFPSRTAFPEFQFEWVPYSHTHTHTHTHTLNIHAHTQ